MLMNFLTVRGRAKRAPLESSCERGYPFGRLAPRFCFCHPNRPSLFFRTILLMQSSDEIAASSFTWPTIVRAKDPNNPADPLFTIIVGHCDADGGGVGETVFQVPASTFAAFPDTLLHDRTHRILQFRDPYLIQLPDCSPVVFRRVVLPFYDTAERKWHVPVHLGFPKNVLLSANTFLGRLVEAVHAGESSGNEDGDHDLEEAGELSPARINHDLQFLGIPSPFDPRWSFSVFAWTANGRAALQRMGPALEQIKRAQKEAAETTESWMSMIKEFNEIWPQLVTARMADSFTESKMAGQTEEEHHTEPQDQEGPEQEESSSCSDLQQVVERDSSKQLLSELWREHDEESSDQGDQIGFSSTSSDASSTPKPVALIASAELQEELNSFFRVGEMAEAAEELMKKWEHVSPWEIPEFQFAPQACPASDFKLENEASLKTLTVLNKLFGLQNTYFRRMDLAHEGDNHSRGCYYYNPYREIYLSARNPKLGDDFQCEAAPGDLAKRESIVFGDVSTLPQQDALTAVYHPAALQQVPLRVFNFEFSVKLAERQEWFPTIPWPRREGWCREGSYCTNSRTFASTICVVVHPFMG
ncbi:hypothetical protein DFJ73DRAFT_805296 [Zopfochytrium polystomum]|nr:hypothetical protein DFJ73DRAFT_805296 [Zopfochytrium polystomum]